VKLAVWLSQCNVISKKKGQTHSFDAQNEILLNA
jgi:hypothetical protein